MNKTLCSQPKVNFLPLDAGKTFAKKNLRIAWRYPSLVAHLARRGRIGAYEQLHKIILSALLDSNDHEIRNLLDKTIETQRLTLPSKIGLFNGTIGLVPQVMAYYVTMVYKPLRVVETGVWTGKTTWFILQALERNNRGTLISIDLGTTRLIEGGRVVQTLPTKEIGGLIPTSLRHRWTLLIGDSGELLKELATRIDCVDFFLHDSDHTYRHMIMELETMWPLLSEGGLLCSDDISRNRAWSDFLTKVGQTGVSIESIFGLCQKTKTRTKAKLLHSSGHSSETPMLCSSVP
jgi:predicted O-methyltransferase YrrM